MRSIINRAFAISPYLKSQLFPIFVSILFIETNLSWAQALLPKLETTSQHSIKASQTLSRRYEALSGRKTNIWDQTYDRPDYLYGKEPIDFIRKNIEIFSERSKILDMGMAEGRNAVYLAEKGHDVLGIDLSIIAINKALKLAKEKGVKIRTMHSSMKQYSARRNSFDVILSIYYFDKDVLLRAYNWLRPGGVFIIEAFAENVNQLSKLGHSKTPYMNKNELFELFPKMKILKKKRDMTQGA